MEILTIQEKYVATLEENMKDGEEIVANEYIAEKKTVMLNLLRLVNLPKS